MARMPCSMLSWPSDGPTVRSSTLKIGASSAPARSSSARSRASTTFSPVIWKRLENTPRMMASLITVFSSRVTNSSRSSSSRLVSMNSTPIGLFRFSWVASSIASAPRAARLTCTAGWPFSSNPCLASTSWPPSAITARLRRIGWPAASYWSSQPSGARPRRSASRAFSS